MANHESVDGWRHPHRPNHTAPVRAVQILLFSFRVLLFVVVAQPITTLLLGVGISHTVFRFMQRRQLRPQ